MNGSWSPTLAWLRLSRLCTLKLLQHSGVSGEAREVYQSGRGPYRFLLKLRIALRLSIDGSVWVGWAPRDLGLGAWVSEVVHEVEEVK